MTEKTVVFPCDQLPDDATDAKLVGLYAQRQEGRWMQRTKVLGGRLCGDHWRALAEAARRFSPQTPLHLTTRQDVEFHDIAGDIVPSLQQFLADAGMTGLGACGDTVRNVTVCPCSGLLTGRPDLEQLAWAIRRCLAALPEVFTLPRKFKTTLACGDECSQAWINDLGLVAAQVDGQWRFAAIVGGSLGADPLPGLPLMDSLTAEDTVRLARAMVVFFNTHGDRTNRSRARLRHVRRRMGDEAFAAALREAFQQEPPVATPLIDLPVRADGLDERITLTFINGDVTPDAADALASLAGRDDLAVRIDCRHRIHVFGRDHSTVGAALAEHPLLAEAVADGPTVIACPGKRWCERGLADTNALADQLRQRLTGGPPGLTVCVSGCPNGCAHSRVAPIGLLGRRMTRDDEKLDGFDITFGGELGCSSRLGEPVAGKLTADEAVEEVLRLADDSDA